MWLLFHEYWWVNFPLLGYILVTSRHWCCWFSCSGSRENRPVGGLLGQREVDWAPPCTAPSAGEAAFRVSSLCGCCSTSHIITLLPSLVSMETAG